MALTVDQLEALPEGAQVCRVNDPTVVYTRIPGGPNGPWRRYEYGVGPVTCRSSVLVMIGVEVAQRDCDHGLPRADRCPYCRDRS